VCVCYFMLHVFELLFAAVCVCVYKFIFYSFLAKQKLHRHDHRTEGYFFLGCELLQSGKVCYGFPHYLVSHPGRHATIRVTDVITSGLA
jgi:hypothetical protein